MTLCNYNFIKMMLVFIYTRYINEDVIDIASIFKTIAPELDNISAHLNIPTETDKKLLKKYNSTIKK